MLSNKVYEGTKYKVIEVIPHYLTVQSTWLPLLYHRPFLHDVYGIYFVTYNTVAYHVLIQSPHHTHCISFNTNPCICTGVSFSISISLWFNTSLCFLPTVIVSASFYELHTYIMSQPYLLYICFVLYKVIDEIY